MAYFVGIDSGGTKTECCLGDEERVLARATGGSVKLTRVGEEIAAERLRALLAEVLAGAGVRADEVAATCVGMSGYSIPRLREWMGAELRQLIGGVVEVCGDEEIALDAAFRGGPGILVIAGTGSIAVGRCADGTRFTAGGWGPVLGDEGSGAWIGQEGLRAGLHALDSGVNTGLVDVVCRSWGASDLGELVGMAHRQPAPDFAALTPLVVQLAAQQDQVAEQILRRAGASLAALAGWVWQSMQAAGETAAPVATAGSVLDRVELVRESFREALPPDLRLSATPVVSVEGALWRAR